MLLVSGATRTMARLGPRPDLGRLFEPSRGADRRRLAQGWRWAADNGCYGGFDEGAWLKMLEQLHGVSGCLFVVVPDVVGDHDGTLRLWRKWSRAVHQMGFPAAFVAQDGCDHIPTTADALFIGGTTKFKLSHRARQLTHVAKADGLWVHMGRVNSRCRMRVCSQWGIDSIDGTRVTKWPELHLVQHLEYARFEKAQRWLL